ncbi:MAG: hypothetical protein IMZ66_00275, partial [Planctomycetes bacterium]|nr:hypothetical protein [Planctomycetota bacterium]
MTRAQVVSVAACLVFLAGAIPAAGQYKAAIPGPMPAGAIEVRGPGACDQPGKTYILMKDITCDASGLFLAANVTLDLNGHTLTYAGAKYEHVPNYGFEKDLQEWDVSKAPGA